MERSLFSVFAFFRRESKEKRRREKEDTELTKGRVGVDAGSSRWSKRSEAGKRETTILLPTDIRYKLGRAITAFAVVLPRFLPSFLPTSGPCFYPSFH